MTVVPPPSRLLSDRYIVLKRLLGPGPSNMPNETMNALHNPLLGHLHSDFIEVMRQFFFCQAAIFNIFIKDFPNLRLLSEILFYFSIESYLL